jgi:hypothetical protein
MTAATTWGITTEETDGTKSASGSTQSMNDEQKYIVIGVSVAASIIIVVVMVVVVLLVCKGRVPDNKVRSRSAEFKNQPDSVAVRQIDDNVICMQRRDDRRNPYSEYIY